MHTFQTETGWSAPARFRIASTRVSRVHGRKEKEDREKRKKEQVVFAPPAQPQPCRASRTFAPCSSRSLAATARQTGEDRHQAAIATSVSSLLFVCTGWLAPRRPPLPIAYRRRHAVNGWARRERPKASRLSGIWQARQSARLGRPKVDVNKRHLGVSRAYNPPFASSTVFCPGIHS